MKRLVYVLMILTNLFALAACATLLQVGIERTASPTATAAATVKPTLTVSVTVPAAETATPALAETELAPAATPTLTEQPTASPTPAPALTPTRQAPALKVAFVQEDNVWLWSQGAGTTALTSAGGVNSVKISDDGQVVAFVRGLELWAVNSDGSDERKLISIEDIAAMVEPGDPGVRLYRVEWVPGTHTVAFNTHLNLEIGLVLNDDLRLVNADTLEQRVLLPRGKGGEFYYSPDGRQIALVRTGTITLVDAEGQNLRDALTYTPPATYSEAAYYAQPVWAADSGSLRAFIPPPDLQAQPPQLGSVWHLQVDGRPARLIGTLAARAGSRIAFSPDLSHVAYLGQAPSALPGSGEEGLLVTNLDDGETIAYAAQAHDVYGWSPDAQHLAFLSNVQLPQAQIGRPGSDPVPAYGDADVAAIDVRWIDASRYLVTAITAQGQSIVLGEIGGAGTVVATVTGRSLSYDLAR